MSEYFSKPKPLSRSVKVELDLSNYATIFHLKNVKGVDTSEFAKKTDLASLRSNVDELDFDKFKNVPNCLRNLKSKVDRLDVDKLVPVTVYLSKLSHVVKNDVVKKTGYDELVKKVNDFQSTDTSNLVQKADSNTKLSEIENKILDHNHDKYITTLYYYSRI